MTRTRKTVVGIKMDLFLFPKPRNLANRDFESSSSDKMKTSTAFPENFTFDYTPFFHPDIQLLLLMQNIARYRFVVLGGQMEALPS